MKRLIDWVWKALFYVLIQVADRIPRKKVPLPPVAGLRPEESERPAPIQHKVDPVTPDRPLYFASPADQLGFRLACARAEARLRKINEEIERDRLIAEDIEDLCGPIREGDPR